MGRRAQALPRDWGNFLWRLRERKAMGGYKMCWRLAQTPADEDGKVEVHPVEGKQLRGTKDVPVAWPGVGERGARAGWL